MAAMNTAPSTAPARIVKLVKQGDELWNKRANLESFWQEVAENFFPERADFTTTRFLGTEFGSNLMTSYPLLCRRELGDSIASMLRPPKEWFEAHTSREDRENESARAWLQMTDRVQRRAMYDIDSQYVRAAKLCDHDFATFGQSVMYLSLNRRRSALLYRCVHLKDVVWADDAEGNVCVLHEKRKVYAVDVVKIWPDTASKKTKEYATTNPYTEVEIRCVRLMSEDYEAQDKPWRFPYVSVWLEADQMNVLEEKAVPEFGYMVARWVKPNNTQYAWSPATVAGLADGRLLQAQMLSLLEAGEKAANPPLLAVDEMIRSDVNTFAGGVTSVDSEFDGNLENVLRPISQDFRGLPISREMVDDNRKVLEKAFYLDTLKPFMPTQDPEMTAYQAGQIVQEYIRKALPLFEPIEEERNGKECTETFKLLLRTGTFGSPMDIPPSIRDLVMGSKIQYHFESPLTQAIDADKGQRLLNAKGLIASVSDLDPGAHAILKVSDALRDALRGIQTPAKWLASEDEMAAQQQQQKAAAAAGNVLDLANKAATVGVSTSKAAQQFAAAGLQPDGSLGAQPVA